MPSLKQLEANRLNAQKSTGPRTEAGKAVSRFNALKSGIDAQASVIPGEDPDELQALAAEYHDRFTPTLPEHRALVDTLVANEWLLRRFRKIEGQLWAYEMQRAKQWDSILREACPLGAALNSAQGNLVHLQRRIDSADRAFHRALNQLRRLQQTPLQPVPEDQEPAEPPAPTIQLPPNQQPGQGIGFVPPIAAQAKPVARAARAESASVPAFRGR